MKSNFIRLLYADNTTLNPGALGDTIATKDVGGVKHELVVNEFSDGSGGVTQVSAADPLPVTDNAAEVSLASIDLKTSDGSQKTQIVDAGGEAATVTGGKLDVNATVDTTGLATSTKQSDGSQKTQVVDGAGNIIGATANALDVNIKSGNVTLVAQDIQIGAVELKNGTDDTRAVITAANALKTDGSAVTQPISAAALPLPTGAAIAANQQTDALTNTQLRASAVPVSASSLPLPSGASTETTLASVLAKLTADPATQTTLAAVLAKIIAAPSTEAKQDVIITSLASIDAGTAAALGQALMAASVPVVIASNQSAVPISGTVTVDTSLLATAAKQDTGNASLSTIAGKDFATQTTLAAVLAKLTADPATQTTLAAILAKLIAAPSTEAKQDTIITALGTLLTISDFDSKTGSLTETAPATDTASSGVNGRLQRIAQRITSLITAVGSPFQAGGSIGNTSFAATQATAANLNMTEASAAAILAKLTAAAASMVKLEDVASADGDAGTPAMAVRKATPANTSGTDGDYEMLQMSAGRLWVDASGKTLTTDGSGVTQPVSASALPLPSGAATSAKQDTGNTSIASVDSKIPALGQALMTGSIPVVMASNQTTVVVGPGAAARFPITGIIVHDASGTSENPVLTGGYASAAAPTDVSADGDGVRDWNLRNGAKAVAITAAGALIPGDATNGLDVDVTRLPALVAGSAIIGKVGIDQTTPGTTNGVQINAALPAGSNAIGKLAANSGVDIGDVDVTSLPALVAGSALIGKVGIDQTTPGTTNATTPVPAATGGLSTYHLVSAATTNASVVKASAGQVYGWYIYNSNAAARKVAFHNAASTPTAGASIFYTLVIPPNSGANVSLEMGIAFSTGIAISTVTGLADNDSAAVAANDLIINIFYK